METWLPFLAGLVMLVIGGELLVRGAVNVASNLGISPLVIGLTLVGFGTSTPELVTSVQAALSGSPGIAYGNIVGSNTANILLILGVAAIVTPIAVASATLRRDGAVMVAAAVIFSILALTVPLGRMVGVVFVGALILYIFLAFRQESGEAVDHGAVHEKSAAMQGVDPELRTPAKSRKSTALGLATSLVGLAIVVGGGYFLVNAAIEIARSYDISETVIGLTIVAVGTSMPELVTSLVAAIRKQADVAFGNIIGSNIYNILAIGGATALIAPSEVPREIATFDNFIMIGASLLIVVLAYTGRRITRREGTLLLAGYVAYLVVLWPTTGSS